MKTDRRPENARNKIPSPAVFTNTQNFAGTSSLGLRSFRVDASSVGGNPPNKACIALGQDTLQSGGGDRWISPKNVA